MSDRFQISFLPWAGLGKTYDLGPVTFWPYFSEADNRVKNPELRDYLDRYLNSYVDHTGEPVTSVTICSHGQSDFEVLDDEQFEELRHCTDALIFSTIAPQAKGAVCANNRSFGPPSSDAFELVTQNFQLDNDYVHVRAGSLLSGGWRIGQITFSQPWTMGGSFGMPSEELINGFSKCFSPDFPGDVRDRLFRSLEWFRLAHTESEQISALSKVVMMATGFEILLQFPMMGKRKHFVDFMENNIASDDFIRDSRVNHKGKSFDELVN